MRLQCLLTRRPKRNNHGEHDWQRTIADLRRQNADLRQKSAGFARQAEEADIEVARLKDELRSCAGRSQGFRRMFTADYRSVQQALFGLPHSFSDMAPRSPRRALEERTRAQPHRLRRMPAGKSVRGAVVLIRAALPRATRFGPLCAG